MTETRDLKPKLPRLEEIDESLIRLDYDRRSDSLWVSFVGESRPVVNVWSEVDDDTMYLVDLETDEVVGLEIEGFLTRALRPPEASGQ